MRKSAHGGRRIANKAGRTHGGRKGHFFKAAAPVHAGVRDFGRPRRSKRS